MKKYLLVLFLTLIVIKNAWAYLDPGSVSLWLQGIIAGIALALTTIKLWWFRLREILKIILKKILRK